MPADLHALLQNMEHHLGNILWWQESSHKAGSPNWKARAALRRALAASTQREVERHVREFLRWLEPAWTEEVYEDQDEPLVGHEAAVSDVMEALRSIVEKPASMKRRSETESMGDFKGSMVLVWKPGIVGTVVAIAPRSMGTYEVKLQDDGSYQTCWYPVPLFRGRKLLVDLGGDMEDGKAAAQVHFERTMRGVEPDWEAGYVEAGDPRVKRGHYWRSLRVGKGPLAPEYTLWLNAWRAVASKPARSGGGVEGCSCGTEALRADRATYRGHLPGGGTVTFTPVSAKRPTRKDYPQFVRIDGPLPK